MFTTWLFEQRDRNDSVGKFANLAFDDCNAGCALRYPTAVGWRNHFEKNHSKNFDKLLDMLGDAYVDYNMSK